MNRQQLRSLIKRPYFNAEAIQECLAKGPNYEDKYYEDTIREDETEPYYQGNRFEVLEYWGVLDSKLAKEAGLEGADQMSEFDEVQVNVWVCGSMVIRCVLNPFTPARIPYQVFPYEINPYQLWGVGVAENMEDAEADERSRSHGYRQPRSCWQPCLMSMKLASCRDRTWTSSPARYSVVSRVSQAQPSTASSARTRQVKTCRCIN